MEGQFQPTPSRTNRVNFVVGLLVLTVGYTVSIYALRLLMMI